MRSCIIKNVLSTVIVTTYTLESCSYQERNAYSRRKLDYWYDHQNIFLDFMKFWGTILFRRFSDRYDEFGYESFMKSYQGSEIFLMVKFENVWRISGRPNDDKQVSTRHAKFDPCLQLFFHENMSKSKFRWKTFFEIKFCSKSLKIVTKNNQKHTKSFIFVWLQGPRSSRATGAHGDVQLIRRG